jgi:hypothetical protein
MRKRQKKKATRKLSAALATSAEAVIEFGSELDHAIERR